MLNTQFSSTTIKNLRVWNGIMAFLHAAQGIAMAILSRESLFQVYQNLPAPDIKTRSLGIVAEAWYQVNLGYVIASFLFLSALAHLITILPGVFPWYIKNLDRNINLIRWYEYALSSSVMVYVIGALNGISDGWLLFALVGLNVSMNLFGASMEMHNSDKRELDALKNPGCSYKPNWWHFVYGCFAGILPWIVMGVYFYTSLDRLGSIEELPQGVKDVLNTIRIIFPALFVFFNLFAINMVLQYKGIWKWRQYIFGEKMYILLSLVAKSFLAWFIWGGTLRG